MTRKHFVMIAKAISVNSMSKSSKVELAEELRIGFKKSNPAFDYMRFLDACLEE